MSSSIQLRVTKLEKLLKTARKTSRADQAAFMGISEPTWSRVRTGQRAVTTTVIAGVLRAFPDWDFSELFVLSSDDDAEAAA